MKPEAPKDLERAVRARGGVRKGAGRPKRSGETIPHVRRPDVSDRHPLHVTLRVRREIWNLRSERGLRCVRRALRAEQQPGRLRIVHYSVQGNHVHMLVEADDRVMFMRRMRAFSIRFAKAINRMMARARGRVIAERYHARALRTPTETRNALRYVLLNHVKHAAQAGRVGITVDPCSSGPWFPHWAPGTKGVFEPKAPPLTSRATSSLLTSGWRRAGATIA